MKVWLVKGGNGDHSTVCAVFSTLLLAYAYIDKQQPVVRSVKGWEDYRLWPDEWPVDKVGAP